MCKDYQLYTQNLTDAQLLIVWPSTEGVGLSGTNGGRHFQGRGVVREFIQAFLGIQEVSIVPVTSMLAFQLVRTASFSRGGQMSFTNLDVPSTDRFQLSFGFQTFQPSGTLLNHQTRVRHGVQCAHGKTKAWLHTFCQKQQRDFEG